MALRTAMRGALIVRRRLSSLKRICSLSPQQLDNTGKKKPHQANLCGFVSAVTAA
jgi:hypothetical protein